MTDSTKSLLIALWAVALWAALSGCSRGLALEPSNGDETPCEARSHVLCQVNAACYSWTDSQEATCMHEAMTQCSITLSNRVANTCIQHLYDATCQELSAGGVCS